MKNLIWVPVVLFFAFLFSCTKQGPAGPAGPAGGSRVNSTEFIVMPADWQQSTAEGCTSCYYANIIDTAITAEVISGGSVWAFWVNDSAGQEYLQPLPVTVDIFQNELIKCFTSVGMEEIYLQRIAHAFSTNQKFKIVALSPEMLHIHPELNRPQVAYEELKPLLTGAALLPQTSNKLTTIPRGN